MGFSLKKSFKRAVKNVRRETTDPLKKEASRVSRKIKAEVKRVPDNVGKGIDSVKRKAQQNIDGLQRAAKKTLGQAFSLLPGSNIIKFIGIGLVVIIAFSIFRRAKG